MSREMVGTKFILNLLIFAVLIYDVIGKRHIFSEKTSSEQLKAKLRQPVKTVKTEHGDVYDCIDFYEQPAFDHPLLKNHNYHFDMKPSSMPKEIPNNEDDKTEKNFKLKPIGCPRGTIPIRRTTIKNSLSQTNDIKKYYAGTATRDDIGKIYGAGATISLDNPKLFDGLQFSNSIISIQNNHEFLHAGWTVNPHLYGDYNTRFYIWMNSANGSCYNTNCPGFVITNPNSPLDSICAYPNATAGKTRYATRIFIYRDRESGDWWMMRNFEQIGFWPKAIFNSLSVGAYKAYYGGVVGMPLTDTSFPQMGTGNRPRNSKVKGNSYSRVITTLNVNGSQDQSASRSDILESLNERYVARNLHQRWWRRQEAFESTILFGGS